MTCGMWNLPTKHDKLQDHVFESCLLLKVRGKVVMSKSAEGANARTDALHERCFNCQIHSEDVDACDEVGLITV